MTYLPNEEKTPTGELIVSPVSGRAASTNTSLAAGGSWSTDWISVDNYVGVATTLFSDVPGSYLLEYSEDGSTVGVMPPITIQYTQVNQTRKGSFSPSAKYVRFKYTNGSTVQTKFIFNVDLNDTQTQPSAETLNAAGADTRMASWTKTRLETKTSDVTNDYAAIYRNGNALRVYVDNQATFSPTDVSALAKDTTLKDGTSKVQITNFPTTQSVTVTNPTAATDTTLLAKDATLSNGNQTSKLVNGSNVAYGTATTPLGTRLSDGTGFIDPRQVRTLTSSDVVTVSNPQSSVSVSNFPASQAVTGTFWQATQPVSGPLTDTQLRASPVPVTGTFAPSVSTSIINNVSLSGQGVISSSANKVIMDYEALSPNSAIIVFLYNQTTTPTGTANTPQTGYIRYFHIGQSTVVYREELNWGGFTNGIAYAVYQVTTAATPAYTLTTSSVPIRLNMGAR